MSNNLIEATNRVRDYKPGDPWISLRCRVFGTEVKVRGHVSCSLVRASEGISRQGTRRVRLEPHFTRASLWR